MLKVKRGGVQLDAKGGAPLNAEGPEEPVEKEVVVVQEARPQGAEAPGLGAALRSAAPPPGPALC